MSSNSSKLVAQKLQNSVRNSSFMRRLEEKRYKKDIEIASFNKQLKLAKSDKALVRSSKFEYDAMMKEIEKERNFDRYWFHIDLDMFYVACEMRDDPNLRDKPVAVGGSVISTSNYAARGFGVRSGMPTFLARELCQDLILIESNFPKYEASSKLFMEILREYDPHLESLGCDEGRLDITDYLIENNHPTDELSLGKLLASIRKRIHKKIGVTASAGCAPNQMLAKLCSEVNKPNGQFFLKRNKEACTKFIEEQAVRKIPGIGSECEYILNGLGISTGLDLKNKLLDLFLIFRRKWVVNLARRALAISRVSLYSNKTSQPIMKRRIGNL